jgi:hypothetical protein
VGVADFAPVANATDMLVLSPTTKDIRVTYADYAADATGSTTADIYFFKRTVADTGGASSAPAICKHDSQDVAPTGVVALYSANPTISGSGAALVRGSHIAVPAATTAVGGGLPIQHFFGNRPSKCVVLRAGTGEQFCISNGGNAIPAGMSTYMNIEWTEE